MSLYADCKVIVNNNQLQHQACDPFVVIEQGFKSNLKSKIYPEKLVTKLTRNPTVVQGGSGWNQVGQAARPGTEFL